MIGQRILYLLGGTVLTLLLQMAVGLFGPLGLLFSLAVPMPAAIAGMRQGASMAGGVVLLTAAIIALLGDGAGTAAYLLQFGLGSFLLPLLLRRGWAWDRALAVVVLVITAFAALTLAGYVVSHGVPAAELTAGYVQKEMDQAMAIYREAGVSEDQLQELAVLTRQMADFLLRTWPALAIIAIAAVQLLTLLAIRIASRGRYLLPGPPFRQWKAPEPLIWGLIASGAGLLLADGLVERAALNLLVIVLPLYFVQGLAIIHFYFWKRQVSPLFRNAGYLLIAVLNPLPLIVTGMGVFDLWIEFRKPRVKKV